VVRRPSKPAYAVETHIDEIAETLGLDPRPPCDLRNVPRDGEPPIPVNGFTHARNARRGMPAVCFQERWLQDGLGPRRDSVGRGGDSRPAAAWPW